MLPQELGFKFSCQLRDGMARPMLKTTLVVQGKRLEGNKSAFVVKYKGENITKLRTRSNWDEGSRICCRPQPP